MTWDAARAASRRPLPKPRKLHDPVGTMYMCTDDKACRNCGHLLCSCKFVHPNTYGRTVGGIPIHYNEFIPHGKAFWLPGFDIQCGLLLPEQLENVKMLHLAPLEPHGVQMLL